MTIKTPMKLLYILICLLFLPFSLFSQPSQQPFPEAGVWSGKLIYQTQTTEFYLGLYPDDNGDLIAHSYMPVIPFLQREIGVLTKKDSFFVAGGIQFSLDSIGKKITGTFPDSPRGLLFELSQTEDFPKASEPVSSRSTATPVWTFETEGPVWGAAAADEHNIYIGSSDGNLYGLSQSSGELTLAFQTEGAIFSRPLAYNNHIYTLSDDGNLYKLDIEAGTPAWIFDTGGEEWERKLPNDENPGYDSMASAAVAFDGIIYIGSADGHLYAIDEQNGTEKWHFKTGGPIHSIPVVAEGRIYFGSYDHHVYSLDAATGELNWKFDTGQLVISSPVYDNGKVIIGSRSADLYALNASTGLEEWRYFHWGSWIESSGTIFDGLFYIGSSDDQLLKSFDPDNGNLLWSANLGGSPWSMPAVTQNTVYTGTFGNANYGIDHRGGFFAVDRLTGKEKWRFMWKKKSDTDIYGVVSSPVVANEMVFFGGLDGLIYGFLDE